MFANLIKFLKGVISKMFSKNQIEAISHDQVTMSGAMIDRMALWERMLAGRAPWVEDDDGGVKSLGLEGAICREFANVTLSEMDTKLENEKLDELYQKAISGLSKGMQTGLGLGSFVIKPIGSTGEFECIPANRIVPLEYGADGKLRKCIFIQIKPIGDSDVYYRLEKHELVNDMLHIENKAFKGTASNLGKEIPLSAVEEWKNLAIEMAYPIDRMDFGFYKNPIPNMIDGSENGVSIFDVGVDKIRKCDIQDSRLDWEYSSGERLVYADYTALQKQSSGGKTKWVAPKGKERMFVGTDLENQWEEHSPALRDQNYINGKNEYKRDLEFVCCLAYGDLSKNEVVEKTATEIEASKQRKYNMVNEIQKNLKTCLEDLAYAIAFYQAQYTSHIGFQCVFHDSILTDEKTEREQDRIDMQMGIMSKVEYRMKWYGEDDHMAADKIAEATQEIASQSEGDIE